MRISDWSSDVCSSDLRREWPFVAPGQAELAGSRALVIGYGTIGRLIGHRLAAFDVAVTGVTRSGRDETLTTDRWRARLSEFDWEIGRASGRERVCQDV